MDRYYYFVNTLPVLYFSKKPDINKKVFIDEAEKWLTGNDFSILKKLLKNEYETITKKTAELDAYFYFISEMTEQIVKWRQEKESILFPAVAKILSSDSDPLKKEIALLKMRWDMLVELEYGHFYSNVFIFVYFLKLEILDRLYTFDKEIGMVKFKEICEVQYDRKIDNTLN
ncbi:MAG: hypothetical protein PHP69_04015 [Candidatus Omnitrophica bacterium]|jgi:hypothetical protein|nr:hypothetical protein [Candidatus Omnitrophota bacterium]MDD5081282.1 hypothetical protein [Candidatus Omnitrophota bacterium]MDD5441436.1 hypothetical protein [Candidatus Omnitrophota bacterium]